MAFKRKALSDSTLMPDRAFQHEFAGRLLAWSAVHGRKNLPWQQSLSPYRVWISEIMLQQTQVATVIPYFERFMAAFPEVADLSAASEDSVLAHWSGLGYYSRARNLHKTARILVRDYQGRFPEDTRLLQELPGIGPSTAAAIVSLAFDKHAPILDGNVVRVLSRCFMIDGWAGESRVKKSLWALADACMCRSGCAAYTQAIMDLGALCCTRHRPDCQNCPLKTGCLAFKHNQIQAYPVPRPKKMRPVQQVKFLVLYNEDKKIYLKKRPPSGVWGGLWCLPEMTWEGCPETFIRDMGFAGTAGPRIFEMQHAFTHFHMQIQAQSLHIHAFNHSRADSAVRWFSHDEFDTIGLSGPIRRIIHFFMDEI